MSAALTPDPVDGAGLRAVMTHLPSGVAVLTTRDGDVDDAVTVNSLVSVSLDPPLVLVSLGVESRFAAAVRRCGLFAAGILPAEAGGLALTFARRAADRPPGLSGEPHRRGATGVALLDVALASVECRLFDVHRAGDHDLFIGRVVAAEAPRPAPATAPAARAAGLPLVNWRGTFGTVTG